MLLISVSNKRVYTLSHRRQVKLMYDVYIYIYMCVCVCVCMYVMYVCMHACTIYTRLVTLRAIPYQLSCCCQLSLHV
jgi:hypothetical protein